MLAVDPIHLPSLALQSALQPILPAPLIRVVDEYFHSTRIINTKMETIAYGFRSARKTSWEHSDTMVKALKDKDFKRASLAALKIDDEELILDLALREDSSAIKFLIAQAEFGHYDHDYIYRDLDGRLDRQQIERRIIQFKHNEICYYSIAKSSPAEKLGIRIMNVMLDVMSYLQAGPINYLQSVRIITDRLPTVKTLLTAYLSVHPVKDLTFPQPQHKGKFLGDPMNGQIIPCDCYENYPDTVAKKILDQSLIKESEYIAQIYFDNKLQPANCIVSALVPARVVHYAPKDPDQLIDIRCHAVFRNFSDTSVRFWLKNKLNPNTEIVHQGVSGLSMLIVAIRLGELKAVMSIVEAKANLSEPCYSEIEKYSETPLECAKRLKHDAIVEFLNKGLV